MSPSDVPFGWGGLGSAPVTSAAVGHPLTALEYAKQANPDEDWLLCCVCGCMGDCSSYDQLAFGLLLMADGTLARAAWCAKLACSSERYSSFYIAWHPKSERD